jgi:putative heme-binding domain-containing protein
LEDRRERVAMTFSRIVIRVLGAILPVIHPRFAEADDKPLEPAAELASFKVADGFEVNLFASEKDGVIKPIQIRWDARGRLWVIGSVTYPQIRPAEIPNDKVLILEDSDHDGRSDKTTVFADGLMIPTGLELDGHGGCYVGEGTRLWHFHDSNGDGRADDREIVLRGFGTGDNHQNINSFWWSPGGELMFCQGLHTFSRVETPFGIAKLDEAGFWRLRPQRFQLDSFFGGSPDPQNPWGWAFTHWGQPLLVAGNNGGVFYPLPQMMPGLTPAPRANIWVNARGRKSSGPAFVETSHFPPEWQGVLLTGGYLNNAVWALDVADDGSGFRLTDRTPLIASSDVSFRPVDVKFGPDGAAYICDWFNPIIGHYQTSFRHPDRDKLHGRIWRVTAKGRARAPSAPIAGASLEQLCENLRSPEAWVRYQTKREFAGRETAGVVGALRGWYERLDPTDSKTEHAWFEALGVLETHEAIEPALLHRMVAAKDPGARAYAAGVCARWFDRLPPDFDVTKNLVDLANDADARVRLAAIVAAANVPSDDAIIVVLSASSRPRDPSIETALANAVAVLQPRWQPMLAKAEALGWKREWMDFLVHAASAPDPRLAKRDEAADAKTREMMKNAVSPGAPSLRATPEFVDALVKEVRAHGQPARGAAIFGRAELACLACHSVAGQGATIGPALDGIGSGQPLDFIIGAVLEPQREVKESFEAIEVTTKDGASHLGYRVSEDAKELLVRDLGAGRVVRIARADIAQRRQAGSVMPNGLVDRLSREELRDLFAYLASLGRPIK